MIYEMRVYEHIDGKADDVRRRFEAEVAPRFPSHGIELVGAFVDADSEMLTYLTRFPDEEARKKAWASFGADAGWKDAKARSEVEGPLIAKQRASVLRPVMPGLPIA
ncbi:NIPSNAP family protein [Roseitranquillus sediminis]|uniref:NIPSNAP family protein n=1 Tax=Roseitranquillus sediminis TaxID=2809051 RepID=UPI001D0C09B5|nr:NIPSNAP family protein [Roseitranquillus sediminis]MBM9593190.1 NIPSNAP family protein [Roseitranquillus sediminis]